MQAAAPQLLALLLTAAAAPAWPHGCPLEMYKIDQALSTSKNLDPALVKRVRELRAEAEKLHKKEQHGESMLVLGSAKKLLKIE
jgi:hypothetical protein